MTSLNKTAGRRFESYSGRMKKTRKRLFSFARDENLLVKKQKGKRPFCFFIPLTTSKTSLADESYSGKNQGAILVSPETSRRREVVYAKNSQNETGKYEQRPD